MNKTTFKDFKIYAAAAAEKHLLIAGATGSGKSVFLNGIINHVLLTGSPYICIDLKRVELHKYRRSKQCAAYADSIQTAVNALKMAVRIIEDRYKRMQRKDEKLYSGPDLYIFIDEFADLILQNRKQVSPLIQRICQIGRAAKVHCILCTQTPISKVIPTEIKCNFDARIGLHTRSKQDSINILGHADLELLPEYGKCIYYNAAGEYIADVPMIPEYDLNRAVHAHNPIYLAFHPLKD